MTTHMATALPILCQMLADDTGITLTMSGDNAFAEPGRVNLPLLPLQDKESEVLALGYLSHEVAHIHETDFNVFSTSTIEFLHSTLNILEDARIEYLSQLRYPGSRIYLRALNLKLLVVSDVESISRQRLSDNFFNFLLTEAFTPLDYPELAPQRIELRKIMTAELGHDLLQKIDAQLHGVHLLQSTEEVGERASGIYEALVNTKKQFKPEPPQPQGNQPQGSQQQGDQQQGDQQQGDQQQGSQQQGDQQQGNQQQGNQQQGDQQQGNQQQGNQQQGNQQQGNQQPQESDLLRSARDLVKEIAANQQQGDQQQDNRQSEAMNPATQDSATDKNDINTAALSAAKLLSTDPHDLPKDKGELVAQMLSRVATQTPVKRFSMISDVVDYEPSGLRYYDPSLYLREVNYLSARIRALLNAQTKTRRHITNSGRLVGSMAYKVESGSLAIFERTSRNERRDTSILFLHDASGSMKTKVQGTGDSRFQVANSALLAFACSLEGISGIKTEVSTYSAPKQPKYQVLKRFSEKHLERLKSAIFELQPKGKTPAAEALLTAGSRILKEKSARNIIVLTTDGDFDLDEVNPVLDMLRTCGIEVLTIGLDMTLVEKLRCEKISITNVAEMPTRLMAVMTDMLTTTRIAA